MSKFRGLSQVDYAFIAAGLAVVVAVGGCGQQRVERPDRSTVTGTVTYKGKPVPGGRIRFVSVADPTNSAAKLLSEEGTYIIADAPLGENRVSIDTESMASNLGPRYMKLPEKYLNLETSGLKFNVQAGDNKEVDFKLD